MSRSAAVTVPVSVKRPAAVGRNSAVIVRDAPGASVPKPHLIRWPVRQGVALKLERIRSASPRGVPVRVTLVAVPGPRLTTRSLHVPATPTVARPPGGLDGHRHIDRRRGGLRCPSRRRDGQLGRAAVVALNQVGLVSSDRRPVGQSASGRRRLCPRAQLDRLLGAGRQRAERARHVLAGRDAAGGELDRLQPGGQGVGRDHVRRSDRARVRRDEPEGGDIADSDRGRPDEILGSRRDDARRLRAARRCPRTGSKLRPLIGASSSRARGCPPGCRRCRVPACPGS